MFVPDLKLHLHKLGRRHVHIVCPTNAQTFTLLLFVKCFLSRKDGRRYVAKGLATPPLIFLNSFLHIMLCMTLFIMRLAAMMN